MNYREREIKSESDLPENTTLTYFYKSWVGGHTVGYYKGLRDHIKSYIKENPDYKVVWLEPYNPEEEARERYEKACNHMADISTPEKFVKYHDEQLHIAAGLTNKTE